MRTSSAGLVAAAVGFGLLTSGCGTSEKTDAASEGRVAARAAARLDTTQRPAGDVTIGKDRDGGHVPLRVGQLLTVRLEGDPGTGYGWAVKQVDRRILTPAGGVTFEPSAAPRPGSGGVFSVRLRATRPGETWLRLVYRSPFESAKPPAATFAVHVMVA
ncbi:MAG TPA: protease inhibitor I42 family protein [Streptosporangiaceae bacterium]|nr:protease inhibitor I42 family protein [Streptosporangiaceae bacterium]